MRQPGKRRSPGSSLCLGDAPGGAPCDCWMGSEFWLPTWPPLVLPDWGESLLLAGRKVRAPYFISCDTTWVRVSRDVWAPHQPLLVSCGGCGVCLKWSIYCLGVSCHVRLSLPWPFGWRSRLLLVLSLSVSLGTSRLPALHLRSGTR